MSATRKTAIALVFAFAASCVWGSGSALAEDNDRGEQLWALCTQCHGEDASGNSLYLAPAIAGLPQWYAERQITNFKLGLRGKHYDDIAGMRMRPMAMSLFSDEDVTAVAAYVASLPPQHPEPELEGGDVEKGKQYWATCAACHGQYGEGNEALNAPPLVASSDWYLKTQLANYKARVRGGNPADVYGMQMVPMSYTLPDDQAVLDVLAYIMQLSKN